MVFQSYALYPHMTARDNMGLRLAARGRAEGPRGILKVRETARILQPRAVARPSARVSCRAASGNASPSAGAIVREPEGLSVRRASLKSGTPPCVFRCAWSLHVLHRGAQGHHDLRHARSNRGHDDGRPDRGHARGGVIEQVGTPLRRLQPARQRLRCGFHRLAQDELRQGFGGEQFEGRRRPGAAERSPRTRRRSSPIFSEPR